MNVKNFLVQNYSLGILIEHSLFIQEHKIDNFHDKLEDNLDIAREKIA